MAIKATEIVQALIVLDQAFAAVTRILTSIKEIDGADEPELKRQLTALRARNDARYAELEAGLTTKANGG